MRGEFSRHARVHGCGPETSQLYPSYLRGALHNVVQAERKYSLAFGTVARYFHVNTALSVAMLSWTETPLHSRENVDVAAL